MPPQCGREPHLSFFDATLEAKTSLGLSPVSFRDLGDDGHIGPREKLRWGGIILRREVLHQMKVAD